MAAIPLNIQEDLREGYQIRSMAPDDFWPLFTKHSEEVFAEGSVFNLREIWNDTDRDKFKELRKAMGDPLELCLGVFYGEEFIGWHYGRQESALVFYMQNSAILLGHRRKGLYGRLLKSVLKIVQELGFQAIYSRHVATNNDVIIPKLKAGFLITSMELSDIFGTMVHLTYYPNPIRKKVLDYRAGQIRMDDELRGLLGYMADP